MQAKLVLSFLAVLFIANSGGGQPNSDTTALGFQLQEARAFNTSQEIS